MKNNTYYGLSPIKAKTWVGQVETIWILQTKETLKKDLKYSSAKTEK